MLSSVERCSIKHSRAGRQPAPKKGKRTQTERKGQTKTSMWDVFTRTPPGPDRIRALRLLDLSVCFIAKKLVSLYCLQTSPSKLRRPVKARALVYTPHGFPASSRSCKDTRGSGPVQANVNPAHPSTSKGKDVKADSQAPGTAPRRRINRLYV